MRKTIPWGAGIAALVAIVVLANWPAPTATASAQTVLTEGAKATEEMPAMRVTARMRAHLEDLEGIVPSLDFIPVTFVRRGSGKQVEWLFSNTNCTELSNPQGTRIYKKAAQLALRFNDPFPPSGPFQGFADMSGLVDYEKRLAERQGSRMGIQHQTREGRKVSIVTVEANAQGEYQNDWMKNKTIATSDNRRIYIFDSQTRRLISMQIWLRGVGDKKSEDILVFETMSIEYPAELPDDSFSIHLPLGVEWQSMDAAYSATAPAELKHYGSAKEAATAFLDALSKGDYQTLEPLMMVKVPMMQKLAEKVRSEEYTVKVMSLGEPFKSGLFPGWFVPYEVEMTAGEKKQNKKGNLAVRNDNPAKRWYVDGGF